MQTAEWLPLTEYAARTGVSISTLRRKIKSSAIHFKMDGGKYLIKCDRETGSENTTPEVWPEEGPYFSSDIISAPPAQGHATNLGREEVVSLNVPETELKWRALEARVSGLAKKIDMFSEQISELKMLVRIFEERLDERT
jgi:hypothetical protein